MTVCINAFEAKLFFTRNWVGGFYWDTLCFVLCNKVVINFNNLVSSFYEGKKAACSSNFYNFRIDIFFYFSSVSWSDDICAIQVLLSLLSLYLLMWKKWNNSFRTAVIDDGYSITAVQNELFHIFHIISLLTGDMNSVNWPRSQCVAS